MPFANSTEGETWMSNWCDRCLVDAPYRNGISPTGCPLIVTALIGQTPAEWINGPRDEHGRYSITDQYHCVNFRAPGDGGAEPRPKRTPRDQLELFARDGHEGHRNLTPLPEGDVLAFSGAKPFEDAS
jgi:hypothetical protein